MAYGTDLSNAARRHLEAADCLNRGETPPCRRPDVAGYLYGIAAELALKQMMLSEGLRPREDDRDDPFYLHFPRLRTVLLDHPLARHHKRIFNAVRDGRLMTEWDIRMRYAPSSDVLNKPIKAWAEQSKSLVDGMAAL